MLESVEIRKTLADLSPHHPLRQVAKLLDERNVEYAVDSEYAIDRFGGNPIANVLYVDSANCCDYRWLGMGVDCVKMVACGQNVRISGVVPVEGAVMAVCGHDQSLEDRYPGARRWTSFGGLSMNLDTDKRDALIPVERIEGIEARMDGLLRKVKNQRRDLKRMHRQYMQLQMELLRMSEEALRTAVVEAGYSEGE